MAFTKQGLREGTYSQEQPSPEQAQLAPTHPPCSYTKAFSVLVGFKKIYKYFYSKFQIPSVSSYRFRSVPNYGKESWDWFRVKELEFSITIFTVSMFTLISSRELDFLSYFALKNKNQRQKKKKKGFCLH